MCTEAYVKGHGENGHLRYVTHRKVPEFGSVLSTLLKRLPGLTTRQRCAFVATRPSSTSLPHPQCSPLLRKFVQPNSLELSQLGPTPGQLVHPSGHPPGQLSHSPPPSSLSHSPPPSQVSLSLPPGQLSHSPTTQPSWFLTQ